MFVNESRNTLEHTCGIKTFGENFLLSEQNFEIGSDYIERA